MFDMCGAGLMDYDAGFLDPETKFTPFLKSYSTLFTVYDKPGLINLVESSQSPILNLYHSTTNDLFIASYPLVNPFSKYSKLSLLSTIQAGLDDLLMSCTVGMTSENILQFKFSATGGTSSRCVFLNDDNTQYFVAGYDSYTGIQTGGYRTDSNLFMNGFTQTSGLVSISSSGGTISGLVPVRSITYTIPNQLSTKFEMIDEYGGYSYSFNSIIPSNAFAIDACASADPFIALEGGLPPFFMNPNIVFPSFFDSYLLESSTTESNTTRKTLLVSLAVLSFALGLWRKDPYVCLVSILFFVLGLTMETSTDSAPDSFKNEIWTPDGYLNIGGFGLPQSSIPRMEAQPRLSFASISKSLQMYRNSPLTFFNRT